MISLGLVCALFAAILVVIVNIAIDFRDAGLKMKLRAHLDTYDDQDVTIIVPVTDIQLAQQTLLSLAETEHDRLHAVCIIAGNRSSREYRALVRFRQDYADVQVTIVANGAVVDDMQVVKRHAKTGVVMCVPEGVALRRDSLSDIIAALEVEGIQAVHVSAWPTIGTSLFAGFRASEAQLKNYFMRASRKSAPPSDRLELGVAYRSEYFIDPGEKQVDLPSLPQAGLTGKMDAALMAGCGRCTYIAGAAYILLCGGALLFSSPLQRPVVMGLMLLVGLLLGVASQLNARGYSYANRIALALLVPFVLLVAPLCWLGEQVRKHIRLRSYRHV